MFMESRHIHKLWTYMDSGHVFLGILSQTLVQQPLVSFSSAFWLPGNEAKGLSFKCQQQCHDALSHSI